MNSFRNLFSKTTFTKIYFVFLLLSLAVGTTHAQGSRSSDSLALVALYNATDGANWTTTWDLSAPMDTWFRVIIKDNRVTHVNSSNNNLNGTIPKELGNLSELIGLQLVSDKLTGGIPSELENLSKLERLALFRNPLGGSIPPELGNLSQLTSLELSDVQLTGSIPSELGKLLSLHEFHFLTIKLVDRSQKS